MRWTRRRASCARPALDVGGIEYLETPDGRRVFYDINANSNLRPSVAAAFGFDPFERVVDYLARELGGGRSEALTASFPRLDSLLPRGCGAAPRWTTNRSGGVPS